MATRIVKELKYEQILSRVQINEEYVVYTVLSSNGKDEYHTTLVSGIATGCDCPAGQNSRSCYHLSGCEKHERFEIAWNAPIVNEMDTVVESPAPAVEPMTVAEFVLGEFGEDLEAHIEDEFSEDFAGQAQAIIAAEKRKAFEAVCEQVREIGTGLNEQQRYSLAKYREVTANMQRLQEMATKREQAPLQPAGHVVEETEFGFIPMRQTA